MTLTAINFVHVNGKWLYIVDWRTVVVVERGNVLHHEKEGGIVRGGYVQGKMSGCHMMPPPMHVGTGHSENTTSSPPIAWRRRKNNGVIQQQYYVTQSSLLLPNVEYSTLRNCTNWNESLHQSLHY